MYENNVPADAFSDSNPIYILKLTHVSDFGKTGSFETLITICFKQTNLRKQLFVNISGYACVMFEGCCGVMI